MKNKPEAKLELVTPQRAAEMLKKNIGNRTITEERVDDHVRRLKAGGWKVTHQGVAFYSDGALADGQHRLTAIVRSGISAEMFVTTGLSREAGDFIDTAGKVRSTSDILKMQGVNDARQLKAMCVVLSAMERRVRTLGNRVMGVPEARSVIERYGSSMQWAASLPSHGTMTRNLISTPVRAAFARAHMTHPTLVEDFASALLRGDTSVEGVIACSTAIQCTRGLANGTTDLALRTLGCLRAFHSRKRIAKIYATDSVLDFFPASTASDRVPSVGP